MNLQEEHATQIRPNGSAAPAPPPPANQEEQARRILRERARILARVPAATGDAEDGLPVVVFTLARERYALESRWVAEVVTVDGLTPIPCTPKHVRGIVNLRGRIVTVIDLKTVFELEDSNREEGYRLIVLRSAAMEFALLADTVVGVEVFAAGKLQPPPPTLNAVRADYLKGVSKGQVAVLDGAKLLAAPWLIVDETVAPA